MKTMIYLASFIFLAQYFPVFAEGNSTALCQKTMQSFSSIGLQLKHSPNLKIEDFNDLGEKQTHNLKLREFLKLQRIPRMLNKNPEAMNTYIYSTEALHQCELLVSKI